MSKISYRSYPILEMINKNILVAMPCYKEEMPYINDNIQDIRRIFYSENINFKKNITVISNTFIDAVLKSEKQLWKILKSLDGFKTSGTLILGSNNPTVFLYNIDLTLGKYNTTLWKTDKNGGFDLISQNIGYDNVCYKSDFYYKSHDIEAISKTFIKTIMLIYAFRNYAKVEIIHSKGKSRTKEFGCKYINETDLDIQYLDSKWFTTLVNSNGFGVRGHFRLQPKKKDGEWTKELIWIDEFQKKGYNRQAGILN